MNDKEFLIDKKELVDYIRYKYFVRYRSTISPIKIQKSLYFLFAFWGGFIQKGLVRNNKVEDKIQKSKYLFDADFSAWTYGPVDSEVYRLYKNIQQKPVNKEKAEKFIIDNDPFVIQFIDNYLDRIFMSSDFGLVDLSHRDSSWKLHYGKDNDSIPSDEIISEYAARN